MKKLIERLKSLIFMFTSTEGTLFTYSFAYALLMGMAPLLLVIILFVSKYVLGPAAITEFLITLLPQDMITPFVNFLTGMSFDNMVNALVLLVLCIFFASNSIYALMLFDEQHNHRNSNKLFLRLLSVINLVVIIIVTSFAVVFTEYINGLIFHFNIGMQVIILFIVFLLFYRLLSYQNSSLRKAYKGALFAALSLTVMGFVFFEIINAFTNYDTLYGPLASIVVLLLSCYVLSCIIYVGYCINQVFSDN